MLPNVRIVPSNRLTEGMATNIGWIVLVDDTHHRVFAIYKATRPRAKYDGKFWEEMTADEHQALPGGFEAQMGQGAISLHSEERLAGSDRGVAMLRRLILQQAGIVAAGGDPLGTVRGEAEALVRLRAGNYLLG